MAGEFIEFIDMRLNDPELTAWDGRQSRVDPGTYVFEVTKVSIDQSRNGNPMLRCTFKVVSDGPMRDRVLVQGYVINQEMDASRRRMKALIDALRVPLGEEGQFSTQSLIGCRMKAEVIANQFSALDPRTGQNVVRENSKIVGESPVDDEQPAAAPSAAAPKGAPVARRTVQAPSGGNNNAQPRRQ